MRKFLKEIFLIMAITAVMCTFSACGGQSSGQKYKAATEPTFPPFDMLDEETEDLTGFDVDLVNAIAEEEGFKVEWSSMVFDELFEGIKSKDIDIAASAVTINDERKKQVAFSEPYYDAGLVLAVKADNDRIKKPKDLPRSAKIAVQIGTSGADFANQLKIKGRIAQVKYYNNITEAIKVLSYGLVDAVINDKPVTMEYMSRQPGKIKIAGGQLSSEKYGIVARKNDTELLKKLNEGLKKLKSNGKYDELLEKWDL